MSTLEERNDHDSVEYKTKMSQLNKYINGLAAAPAQRTKEWYAIKSKTIGGSEVATVLGINPFRSLKQLIAEKCGIGGFSGNTATRWGCLFEKVTEQFTEIVLLMSDNIKEAGSIEGVIERQRYSPDGIGVVQLVCSDGTTAYFTILFEFKSPLRSLPTGSVPKYYSPQIQTGLLNIPLCDTSIFVNNCYRKCSLKNLDFTSTYDVKFHSGDIKKRKNGLSKLTPLACGLICFYQTQDSYDKHSDYLDGSDEPDSPSIDNKYDEFCNIMDDRAANGSAYSVYYEDIDVELLYNSKVEPIDFGEASEKMLDRALKLYEDKRIAAVYFPLITNNAEINKMKFTITHNLEREESSVNPKKLGKQYLNRFLDKCSDNEWVPVGYLPWKLMISNIIIEDAKEDWLETIEEPVNNALAKIDKILAKVDEKTSIEDAYFGEFNELEGATEEFLESIANEGMDMSGAIVGDIELDDLRLSR
jgi:hypothetical protein